MIKAVIFDADGPLYQHATDTSSQEQELLHSYGFKGALADFKQAYEKEKWKGYTAEETVPAMFRTILSSAGMEVSIEEAQAFANDFDALHKRVVATPGALSTLQVIKSNGYRTCVLTDSFYAAEAKWPWFEQIGLKPYLDDMVSSFDIQKLKAAPEAYQACLDKLGVTAEEAIFVGHQQYEMDGAKAASIKSVAILPIATPGIKADWTIDTLSELPGLLAQLSDAD
jgi:FMN phosphatase YigB (HAD superfamily)